MHGIKIIKEPTIIFLAAMALDTDGLDEFGTFLKEQGDCGLENYDDEVSPIYSILDHGGFRHPELVEQGEDSYLTDNEMLCELAGRKCYNSFGTKIGRGSNAEYIANILGAPGKIPHASVLYHAKMSFFFAGISRRVSHELIRHYVGADRSEEGCPSQESTRYTEHPGHFVAHPRVLADHAQLERFEGAMFLAYNNYRDYVESQTLAYVKNFGENPKGMHRKRILEAASSFLPHSASTSMIWTTNPVALAKLFTERCDEASDLEFQRFACQLRDLSYARWPNLFRASNPCKVL